MEIQNGEGMADSADHQDRRIQQVLALRAANRKLKVEELARSVDLGESGLQHLLKRKLGRSLTKHQLEKALQEAARLLTTTSLTARLIRIRCGIPDASNFCHYFKQRFGITAIVYRRRFSTDK